MSDWQPIETAPREGHILIFAPPDIIYVVECGQWDGQPDWWTEARGEQYEQFEATHWMPLPEPPASEDAK